MPRQLIAQSLLEQLADGEAASRIAAIHALRRASAEKMVPRLVQVLDDKRTLMRRNAVLVLGNFAHNAAPGVPKLIELLKDREPFVRQEAASTLSAIGPAAVQAIPALETALQDGDEEVRQNANGALQELRRYVAPDK